MGALGNLSKKNTVKNSNFYDFMLARLAKKASDPTVGICKCELTWARGLRRKEVEPPERSTRPGGFVIGIDIACLHAGAGQAHIVRARPVGSAGAKVTGTLQLYGVTLAAVLFLLLRLLSGSRQRDLLRCSRLVVVDGQFSVLRRGIGRSEGHPNFTALSRRQRPDALALDREWRDGRLTGDRYVDLGSR